MTWYRRAIYAFSGTFIGIGVALLVATARAGGGVTGYLLASLFIALGVARIVLERKRSSS
ncbi:MAG: hypothetical protein U0R50_11290 [Gaiellales bacterium]